MVELKTISSGFLGSAIHFAFKGDWQLIHHYHLVNGDLADCVKSTFYEIDKVSREGTALEYFGIYYTDPRKQTILIGFTVTGPKILLSFGINLKYRSKEIVLEWWQCVLTWLSGEFVTWLFKKNTRAIAFLTRNGMEISEDNGDYVTLLHLKPSVCQQEV
jgi:hypothetical protein